MKRRLLFAFVGILFVFLSYLLFLGIRVKADSCSDTTVTCGKWDYACKDSEGNPCPLVDGLCQFPCENRRSGCGTGTTKTLNCGFDDKGQCTANCNRQWADGTITDCVFEGSCPNITATPTPTSPPASSPSPTSGGTTPSPTTNPSPTPPPCTWHGDSNKPCGQDVRLGTNSCGCSGQAGTWAVLRLTSCNLTTDTPTIRVVLRSDRSSTGNEGYFVYFDVDWGDGTKSRYCFATNSLISPNGHCDPAVALNAWSTPLGGYENRGNYQIHTLFFFRHIHYKDIPCTYS